MRCCPIRRTCLFAWGFFWVGLVWRGGRVGGLGFSGEGGGFAGEVLRGLPELGGLNPQLDSRISWSTHPSHPNSPRLAQQGVFTAQVSVRQRDRSYSRKSTPVAG